MIKVAGIPEGCIGCPVFKAQWESIPLDPESTDSAYPNQYCSRFAAIAFIGVVNEKYPGMLNEKGEKLRDTALSKHAEATVRYYTDQAEQCADLLDQGDISLTNSASTLEVMLKIEDLEYI